jgi:hypothetical protein
MLGEISVVSPTESECESSTMHNLKHGPEIPPHQLQLRTTQTT